MQLSAGVRKATQLEPCNNCYAPDAFLPEEPWRSPSAIDELTLIQRSYPHDYSRTVCITSIPEDIVLPLQNFGEEVVLGWHNDRNLTSRTDVLDIEKNEVVTRLRDYLISFSCGSRPIFSGIGVSSPDLATVTFDTQNNHYIGLHLDSWDGLPLSKRCQSTNRICVNLGRSDRYFLFINLTLMDMLYAVDHETEINAEQRRQWHWQFRHQLWFQSRWRARTVSPKKLCHAFLQRYSSYPVVRVRLTPGDAYIAPTENIIHDGSSSGSTQPDLQVTLRGHFRLPN
ncbi:MAG: hypothetical protein ACFB8W_19695 [Elainellaceae cyanobacterium]